LTFQSPAPFNFLGYNLTILGSLNGTPWNSTFLGGSVKGTTVVGPTGFYGVGNSILFNGMATPTGAMATNFMTKANMDSLFSAGTFTVAKAASFYSQLVAWAVPGHKYSFAASDGSLVSAPLTTFTITSIVDNGTTISINTNLPSTLPTPNCPATPCTTYVAYPAATITQINKPGGSADLTIYAAPP
jgi:hypothetical protein